MLKKFFKGSGNARIEPDEAPASHRGPLDLERLKLLVEFFPIGKKLRYIPEFKKEIVFDTLIVAYVVNGEFLYSWEAIEMDASGYPTAFRVGDRQRIRIDDVKSFQVVVPDTSNLETTLDYHRRAIIGRGRQFNKGNYLSLISNAGARGVSSMDTEVDRQLVMRDGPYANTRMVLVTPELETLAVTDQRNKARSRTCVPVHFSVSGQLLNGPCTIVDVSDEALRIRARDGEIMPAMPSGEPVVLEFDLGESGRGYVISGSVVRRTSEACVVKLGGLRREGQFMPFGPLDVLELKAGLLNYGR